MVNLPATYDAHRGKRARMGVIAGAIFIGLGLINIISAHTPYLVDTPAPTAVTEIAGVTIYSSFIISGIIILVGGFVAASSEAMRRQQYTLRDQSVAKTYTAPFTFLPGTSFDYTDIETIVIQTFEETASLTLKSGEDNFFSLTPSKKFSMNAIAEYKEVVAFLEDQVPDLNYKMRVGSGRGTQIIDIEEPPWDMDEKPAFE